MTDIDRSNLVAFLESLYAWGKERAEVSDWNSEKEKRDAEKVCADEITDVGAALIALLESFKP